MIIVCGDLYIFIYGVMGVVVFGIGISEVEMVFVFQCILQLCFKIMCIMVDGKLGKGVIVKDIVFYMMLKMIMSGVIGYFVEYVGEVICSFMMEGWLMFCNFFIEMGVCGGMIVLDEVIFEYIKGCENVFQGEEWDQVVQYWKILKSEDDVVFDKEVYFDVVDIELMIIYGINLGMGMGIMQYIFIMDGMNEIIKVLFLKFLDYMGFQLGEVLLGKKIDYVFLGVCMNGCIEDFCVFVFIVKGYQKVEYVIVWLVLGFWMVDVQICEEGLDKILEDVGFVIC